MVHKIKNFSIVFCLFSVFAFSQQTAIHTNDLVQYNRAVTLYNNQQYKAAQRLFENVKNTPQSKEIEAECAYYIANCAVRLNQPDAEEQMRYFVENYPTSTKRNSAYKNVARFYFENGKYAQAKKWYQQVDGNTLSKSELEEFYFNNAYVYFKTNDFDKAETFFNKVYDSQEYGSQAKYYIGFMAYEEDEYEEAQALFEEVKTEGRQDKNMSYFQSDMNFKLGKFEKAITLAKEQLPKSSTLEKSELNKIIGESYFNLKQYGEAIPYLEEYRGKKGRWNNTDYYQLGYAYYKQGNYDKAISEFNKIIDGQNSVAQNAYYHLAESYVKLEKKTQALNAFKNASEMSFDTKIQEDAALNYTKLSYEIGNNYKSIPEVLTEFLEEYPNSDAKTEIEELLVDSYITAKNYKEAMTLLENSNRYEDKKVYQKVAYYRGVEFFNQSDYTTARENFDKSLSERNDQSFTAKATYWKAECDYNLGNYSEALIGYKEYKGMQAAKTTDVYKNIDYNIGYVYFKQQNYTAAVKHFTAYTDGEQNNATQKNDAYLRAGDSYFAASDYWPAMEAYNKAIAMKGINSDYAYFQKAISYAFVDRNAQKIDDLNAFLKKYPNSIYRDDALYELGNTYVAEEQASQAVKAYDLLVQKLPNSSFVSRALLKQGLVYYNNNQGEKALEKFKKVVADFPNTDEANQAVQTARNIYVDLGKTDEYATWIKQLDFVEVSDSDIDNATYEAAEQQFINNNTEVAIKNFKKYLDEFPNGAHALPANFHLAQLYYQKDELTASAPHYQYVIEQSRSEYTEQALARLSQVYLEESDYEKAIPVLERLETEADFPQNITFAQSNLMKAFYRQKNYEKAVNYAETVLANDKIETDIKSDAQVYIARSAMKTNNEERAKTAYAEVQKIARGELAAEALYYDAYFKRKDGDYEASNTSVQTLAKEFSGYKKYGAKGLLLMAKNFYDLEDAYQATYILDNIIKNFPNYPNIIEEAENELTRIKAEESKTNSSVETESNQD